jgi:hypothetical protein
MSRLAPFICVLFLLVLPATASAVPIVITGSSGKDEITIDPDRSGLKPGGMVVAGAASVTGPNCTSETNGITNRQTAVSCARSPDGTTVDLGDGDDVLAMDVVDDANRPRPITAAGGRGADTLIVKANTVRTIKGQDGDDVLIAPLLFADPGTVTLDGGLGRDIADYGTAPEGVTASIPAGTATMTRAQRDAATGTAIRSTLRTDTLVDIEGFSGSSSPDLLVGGDKAGSTLLGQGGDDVLRGGSLADTLDGGPGADVVDGRDGADTLTGGPGPDSFPVESGPDSYQTRDGFTEDIVCGKDDVLVVDLVDRIKNPELCPNKSVAAAKHVLDTLLTQFALRLASDRTTRARVACPAGKAEPCAGTLTLRLGGESGPVLARRRFSLAPGRAARLLMALSRSNAARAAGKAVTLQAGETDADGRPRRVFSRVSLLR